MVDELRRRRDDEVIDKIFCKLESISDTQIRQGEDIKHINKTLFTNNGETCVITSLKDLTKSVEDLKTQRLAVITTAQAIWTLIFGFLSVAGTVSAIVLTVKQLRGQ